MVKNYINFKVFLVSILVLPLLATSTLIFARFLFQEQYTSQVSRFVNENDQFINNYYFFNRFQIDGWSDCSSILQGLGDPNKSLIELTSQGFYIGECPELIKRFTEKNEVNSNSGIFPQYWHGYILVTKTLISIFGVFETKLILNVILFSLLIYLIFKLKIKFYQYSIGVLFLLFSSDLPYIFLSLPHIILMIFAIISAIFFQRYFNFINRNIYPFFFIIGFLNTFVDFGFTPFICLMLLNLVYFSKLTFPKNINNLLKINIANLFWMTGLLYSLFAKMLLFAYTTNLNYAYNFFFKRITDDTILIQDFNMFQGIKDTLKMSYYQMQSNTLVLYLTLAIATYLLVKISQYMKIKNIFLFILMNLTILFPITLYLLVTSDVTVNHAWMHSRNWTWLYFVLFLLSAQESNHSSMGRLKNVKNKVQNLL